MDSTTSKARQQPRAQPGTRPRPRTLAELAEALQLSDPRLATSELLSRTAQALGAKSCAWYAGTGKLRLQDAQSAEALNLGLEAPLEIPAGTLATSDNGSVLQLDKSATARSKRGIFSEFDCAYLSAAALKSGTGLLVATSDAPLTPKSVDLMQGAVALLGIAAARVAEYQRLREAQAKLRTILRSSEEYAIFTTDEDFNVVEQNASAVQLFGRDGTGSDVADLVGAKGFSARSFSKIRSAVKRKGSWEGELEIPGTTRADTSRWLHFVITALRGDDNEALGGYLIFARDVTESRVRERRLLDSQRMESVGLLAGGIAHDFNNILMGILGYASLAQDLVDSDHPARRMLTTIEQSAERAASLTSQLMAYCRGGKLTTAPIDADQLLDETMNMLGSSLPARVSVQRGPRGASSNVLGDPTQLQQVFMNLCLNAGEAIVEHLEQQPAGTGIGVISITVRDVTLRKEQHDVFGANNEPLSGKFVLVQVKDNGTGMDETTLRRIFEPFFTTKFTGRGLGLAAVIGIIQNPGGGLVVTSKPGQGSTFNVYLPATKRYAMAIDEATPISLEGSETVLIIDDEAVARQLGLLTLANLGYQVLLAGSGEEGVETYRRNQEQIGLVILDLTMQGMGGHEVLAELAMMEHPVPVLLTSGYDESMAGERMGSRYTTGFLQKPYTPEVLAKAVREVLDKSVV
jgi:signal transduction histidine kinase/ActR/RegA family two-component response regulator